MINNRPVSKLATTSLCGIVASVIITAGLPASAQETATKKTLPTVKVEANRDAAGAEGYKADALASPKFSQPLLDTPQSVSVISSKVMEDRGATTLRDALRTVPGISMAAGEGGGPQGDNLKIRGFAANTDIFIDGMRDIAQYFRDPFNTEQVEVVKGPSSSYAGRGSTGGFVNQVSKTATLDKFSNGTLAIGTDATKRATADVNQPLNLNSAGIAGAALRLNVMAHTNEVAGRDVVENSRLGFAPTLSLGLGSPTRVTLSYLHQTEDNIPDYGIPSLGAGPAPVNYENFYGFRDLNTEETDTDVGTIKVEHDLNDSTTLRNQLRYSYNTRYSIVSPPRNANLAANTVTRTPTGRDTNNKGLFDQFDVTKKFDTAGLKHTLVTGVELGHETYDSQRFTFTAATDSLTNPNPNAFYTGTRTLSPATSTESDSQGIYAFDTIELNKQWQVTGGLRWDRFDTSEDLGTGATNSRVDEMPSWKAAVVYKPMSIGSIYASYGTSFNPSAEALALSNNNTNLDPEESQTYELGTKWDVMNEQLSLTAAVFRIEKTNARTPGLVGEPPTVLNGEQVVDGFEVGAAGNITKDWAVFAGYTFLNSEVTESNTPAEVGKEIQNTPENTFSFWTTYELPADFQIGGGAQYVDNRFANATNTIALDDYVIYDALAAYHVNENVDIRLNVFNLTDEEYIDRPHGSGGHLVPGAGRSALLSTSLRF